MKVRHMPAAFRHSPLFVLRNGRRMLAHTFAGTSLRSLVGLENDRAVFNRFREQRRRDREYFANAPTRENLVNPANPVNLVNPV